MAKKAYIGVATTLSEKSVGDTVRLNVSGVATEFIIVHQGNPSTSLYDASCSGTWVVSAMPVGADMDWSASGSLDYVGSNPDVYMNGDFLAMLDADVRAAVKTVKIPYINASLVVNSGANGLERKVFSLSGLEVGYTRTNDYENLPLDGVCLDYFKDSKNRAINRNYWTRSRPTGASERYVFAVRNDGICQPYNPTNARCYVRPTMVLPSSLTVDGSGNVHSGVVSVARKIKKGYIGVENFVPRALPSGYTQLSHIEATGAQAFDTGFKANQDTRVVLDVVSSVTPTANTCLFGGRTSGSSKGFAVWWYTTAGGGRFDYSGSANEVTFTTPTGTRTTVDANKNVCTVGTTVITKSYTSFQCEYNLFLCAMNTAGTIGQFFTGCVCSGLVYGNGTLIRDYVPCINPNGVVGLYDMVNGTFGGSATSTPFVAGSSVRSVARKIKKAYIGIGGVARPCWSGGELAYYGTITKMAEARWMLAATSNANYAFFGGGRQSTASGRATVDVYDKNLTRQTKSLGEGRFSPAATSVGDYALFGGGQSSSSSYKLSVEAFDLSLSRKNASDLNASASLLAATNIGSYALFAGGQNSNGWRLQITAYNSSLTKSTPNSNLSIARSRLGATSIGEYALFGGGQSNASGLAAMRTEVDAYDKSLTKTTPTALQEGRYHVAASAVGDYALFAGGDKSGGTGSAVVDAYNKSLTRTTPATLSQGRYLLASTSVGDYALFGGGRTGSMGSNVVSVDVYDASLTKTVYESLSAGRYELSATTIGNYALFGGGQADAGMSDAVDAFTVA